MNMDAMVSSDNLGWLYVTVRQEGKPLIIVPMIEWKAMQQSVINQLKNFADVDRQAIKIYSGE